MRNYRRLNHLLALLAFLVMMLLVPALTFGFQPSMGVSLTYMSGHDHGGSRSRDPGAASVFSVDGEIIGASVYWLHHKVSSDSEGNKTEDSVILAVHLRPRWEATERLHLYPLLGPTFRLDDGEPGMLAGAGFDYWIEDIAVSPYVWTIREMGGNYYGYGLFLRYEF